MYDQGCTHKQSTSHKQHSPLDQHHRSFPNFLELALFYLMVLTYFCMFWIWPSKHLLVAIDEVMMMVDRVMSKWVGEPDYGDGDDDDDHSDGASELLAVDPLSAGALCHHLRPLRRSWCP